MDRKEVFQKVDSMIEAWLLAVEGKAEAKKFIDIRNEFVKAIYGEDVCAAQASINFEDFHKQLDGCIDVNEEDNGCHFHNKEKLQQLFDAMHNRVSINPCITPGAANSKEPIDAIATIDAILKSIADLPTPPSKFPCLIVCDNGDMFDIRKNDKLVSFLDGILNRKPFELFMQSIEKEFKTDRAAV